MTEYNQLSLDKLIIEMRSRMNSAKTEADVQFNTAIVIEKLADKLGVTISVGHERTMLSGGRADSLYKGLTIEYKKPRYLNTPRGKNEAINGRSNAPGGLAPYLLDQAIEMSSDPDNLATNLRRLIGVAFDGTTFIFVRFQFGGEYEISNRSTRTELPEWVPSRLPMECETQETETDQGLRRLALLLRNVQRSPLTSEALVGHLRCVSK